MNPQDVVLRQPQDARPKESMRIVSFAVGDQDFALDVVSVVGTAPPLTEVCPADQVPLLHGVHLFRNERVPVVCLRARFGLNGQARPTSKACVLFVEIEDSVFGFRVDALRATQRVLRSEVTPVPPRLFREYARYLRGVIKTDGGYTLLIDADRLLSADEQAALAQSAERVGLPHLRASSRPSSRERRIALA